MRAYDVAGFFSVIHALSSLRFEVNADEVPDPKSGWTAVTNALNKVVTKPRKDMTRFEKKNFTSLEQVRATVEALKNAWRNKISHADGRLALLSTEFNPEIAEEILLASRAFMRRLAEGLPPRRKTK
jgi:hypothetical protein